MAKSWYAFIGGTDPLNTMNYRKLTIRHDCLCGAQICAIYAEGVNLYPKNPFSLKMQLYITDALITGQIQPQMANTKKYVYLKST